MRGPPTITARTLRHEAAASSAPAVAGVAPPVRVLLHRPITAVAAPRDAADRRQQAAPWTRGCRPARPELAPTVGFVNHGHELLCSRSLSARHNRPSTELADDRLPPTPVTTITIGPSVDARNARFDARSDTRTLLRGCYSPDKARRDQDRTAPVDYIGVTIGGRPAKAGLVRADRRMSGDLRAAAREHVDEFGRVAYMVAGCGPELG
jgi:hypothetical protein